MPWHHFQRHSPVRRSPWAWLREHVCPGGGRMVSIVTMCHVRRTQMLCCWQQHAPSGNCQHCQQNAKNAHLMSQGLLDDMYWSACGGSMDLHGIPNRHTYNLAICTCILFECTLCALWSFVHNTLARDEELATAWSTAQSRPWYESACPSAWNARSKTCGLFRAVGQLHATTPKSSAKLRNSLCKSQHVEGQAVPVLRASFQPAGAGYLLHSGWWRGCTHIADLPTATGRQLPGGWSSTNQRQTLQETQ